MKIRNYYNTDYEACMDIFRSNMPLYFSAQEEEQFSKWLHECGADRHAYQNNEVEEYFVIEDEGAIVACGGFYVVKGTYSAFMTWGMVRRSLHHKGYGKKLMEYRTKRILHLFPGYSIHLDTTQHSYRFFEKMGFAVTKVTPDFYTKGMDRYDMIRNA